jgi:hypothetical protein
MKKILIGAGVFLALAFTQRSEAQVRVGVNLQIGHPAPVYYNGYDYYAQPRVIVQQPVRYYYYETDRYGYRHKKYYRKRHDNGLHKGWYKNKHNRY